MNRATEGKTYKRIITMVKPNNKKKETATEKKAKRDKANLEKIRLYKLNHGITGALTQFQCVAILSGSKRIDKPAFKAKGKKTQKRLAKQTKRTKRKQRKNETFYESREWRELRYEALKLHGRQCLCCGQKAPNVELHVDHIRPRSKFRKLELDINNLQILCKDCNLGKSNYDSIDYRIKKQGNVPKGLND